MSERARQLEIKEKARLDDLFQQFHSSGAKSYGWAWIRMNELMVSAAVDAGVDYSVQPYKTLLTICAMRACANTLNERDAQGGKG